jgi:hypothetical protein
MAQREALIHTLHVNHTVISLPGSGVHRIENGSHMLRRTRLCSTVTCADARCSVSQLCEAQPFCLGTGERFPAEPQQRTKQAFIGTDLLHTVVYSSHRQKVKRILVKNANLLGDIIKYLFPGT